MNIKRGDIFYADLSPVVGSEQGGTRPVLIVQNDTGNRHSPTVIAAAITSQTGKARLPTHINIAGGSVGLSKDSVILLEQIRTIDKRRLREHMGRLDDALECFNKAIDLEKHNIDFLLNKGVVLMELGKFEEAVDSFNKVLLRNPDNEDAFFLKEECLENF